MRHLGRVHRVSIQWLHELIGRHLDKDARLLFYEHVRCKYVGDICVNELTT